MIAPLISEDTIVFRASAAADCKNPRTVAWQATWATSWWRYETLVLPRAEYLRASGRGTWYPYPVPSANAVCPCQLFCLRNFNLLLVQTVKFVLPRQQFFLRQAQDCDTSATPCTSLLHFCFCSVRFLSTPLREHSPDQNPPGRTTGSGGTGGAHIAITHSLTQSKD